MEDLSAQSPGPAGQQARLEWLTMRDAQREIEASRERYVELYDSAPIGYLTLDSTGCILAINLTGARMLGVERSQLLGQPLLAFVGSDDRRKYLSHLTRLRHGHLHNSSELMFEPQGRGPIHVQLISSATEQQDSQAHFFHTAMLDISERVRVESELRSERHLLRTLMEMLPDRIFFKDREGRFLRNNPAHLKRLGITHQSLTLGKSDADFFPAKHACQTRVDEQQIMETGRPLHKEECVDWPDGRVDWSLVTKLPLYDENGNIVGTFGISRDINEMKRAQDELVRLHRELEARVRERTEELAITNAVLQEEVRRHRHTEESLRYSEEQIRRVVEAAPNALLMVDSRGRIKLVNSQIERLFGFKREELLGQSVEMLVPERYRGEHPRLRSEYFTAPVARPMGAGRDLFGVRKDGSEVPIEIGLSPIQSAEGNFVLASIIDITERKRAEQETKDALREKETLLKEVHHRVKNNLQIISSVLQLQAGYLQDPSALTAFRECQDRIRSMALIHEQLYQAGNFAGVDFPDYVQRLVSNLMATYRSGQSAVKVEQHIEVESLNLETAIPFGLILSEAISNSLKHAFRGRSSGSILVRLRRSAEDALDLSVVDDGVGLPQSLELETANSLGLRLMFILANQLHGTLEIRRQPGTSILLSVPPNQ